MNQTKPRYVPHKFTYPVYGAGLDVRPKEWGIFDCKNNEVLGWCYLTQDTAQKECDRQNNKKDKL